VRDLVIVITDLYLPGDAGGAAGAGVRCPGLERAARFAEQTVLQAGWGAWLARRLGRAELADVAPACIAAAVMPAATGAATPWIATPLHLSAAVTAARLELRGILRLTDEELAQLAERFRTEFAPDVTLTALAAGEFLLTARGVDPQPQSEPARCVGYDPAQRLARGAGAAPLRRLYAEIEMWLHGQALNEARVRRGALPVTTLWPWGAAGRSIRPEQRAPAEPWFALGADAYVDGLAQLCGMRSLALPQRLTDGLAAAPAAVAVLILEVGRQLQQDWQSTPGEALAHLDERFIAPALALLRRGGLASLTLAANDRLLSLRPRSHLRLWRRARAGLGGLG
jgi:hypothetical protein